MKYKRLSKEELQVLEQDFIHFLASAQITAQDWEKMKREKPDQASELIDVFSDVVYDKVLGKIKFLEDRQPKILKIYSCESDRIILRGLQVKEDSGLDLCARDVFAQWNAGDQAGVSILRSERKYEQERGQEVFALLQSGCMISDGKLFAVLDRM